MDLGDIFSIILSIRHAYHGGDSSIAISGQCPRCETVNADQGDYRQPFHDLGTVDVKVYRDLKQEPLFDVSLQDGFTITGELIKKIRMRPLRFHQLRAMGNPANKKFANLNLISCMAHSFPDSVSLQAPKGDFFDKTLYGRLVNSRKDKENIFDALRKLQPGPVMQIQMECINCSYQWKDIVPWGSLPTFLYGPVAAIES
jgi:hypothetical protein